MQKAIEIQAPNPVTIDQEYTNVFLAGSIEMKKAKKQHKLNREITAQEVRVGEYGIVSLKEALAIADAQELDLVMISETAVPPVKLF